MKTIFILSGVKFKSMKQRPHHMARYFAKKGYRVVFIGPNDIFKLSSKVVSLKEKELFALENIFIKSDDGIYYFDDNISIVKGLKNKVFNQVMNWITDLFLSEDTTIIVGFPMWLQYLEDIDQNITVIYDCMDDWESFKNDLDLGYSDEIVYYERKLASVSDLVIVSAKSLYTKMAYLTDKIMYLPNGVWNSDYKISERTVPHDIKSIKAPIVFFMGALAEWVDIELINYLTKSRPDYSFVFVGKTIDVELPKRENIFFLGEKKYEELPDYLSLARVAIIPFKVNKLTAAVTPLKFYEYLSSGTPVVTTVMPDILDQEGSRTALTYDEFLNYIDEYIFMSTEEYKQERQKALATSKKFDWEILLRPLNFLLKDDEYQIQSKKEFVNNVIHTYSNYKENEVIKEQLLSFYNLKGNYEFSSSLYNFDDVISGKVSVDKIQLALAYFKTGQIRKSQELLKHHIYTSNRNLLVYVDSLLTQNSNYFFEIYLHKLIGDIFNAISIANKLIEEYKNNSKFLGILSGLYLDIAEYDTAFEIAVDAIQKNRDRLEMEKIFDIYTLKFLVKYIAEQNYYDMAEKICITLMNINEEWEKEFVKILSDIYISKSLYNSNV